jgi:hypothetical protein
VDERVAGWIADGNRLMLIAADTAPGRRRAGLRAAARYPATASSPNASRRGASPRGFRVERLVRFAPEGIGYRAEVRVILAKPMRHARGAARCTRPASARWRGTLVFHLDRAGKVAVARRT